MFFTIKNAILLAVTQVAIIVFGVLASGLAERIWREAVSQNSIPAPVQFMTGYGFMLLVIPLVWIASIVKIHNNVEISDDNKSLAFFSGIFLCLVLIMTFLYVVFASGGYID